VKSGTDALFAWCQQSCDKFDVKIKGFTTDWKSGVPWACLVAAYHSGAINPKSLAPGNELANIKQAFAAATAHGVTILLDAEDLVQYQDRKSIITQITMFHKALHG